MFDCIRYDTHPDCAFCYGHRNEVMLTTRRVLYGGNLSNLGAASSWQYYTVKRGPARQSADKLSRWP